MIIFNMDKEKAINISRYFNFILKGYVEYFINAKAMFDKLLLLYIMTVKESQREVIIFRMKLTNDNYFKHLGS